jgi:class 3 adenylate cyclase
MASVPRLDRKLLAILAADMVGYSTAMEADEVGTIVRLQSVRAELIDPAISQHHGRLVKLMGDGALVVSENVVDAVACAAQIQKLAATRNAGMPEHQRVAFRIGINLGDVALVDGDVNGDGVNVAARLEQLADAGGVIVSGTVFDHLQGKVDWPLDFVGEQQVKNISRPVRMCRLRLDGKRARWTLRKAMPTPGGDGGGNRILCSAGWLDLVGPSTALSSWTRDWPAPGWSFSMPMTC